MFISLCGKVYFSEYNTYAYLFYKIIELYLAVFVFVLCLNKVSLISFVPFRSYVTQNKHVMAFQVKLANVNIQCLQ